MGCVNDWYVNDQADMLGGAFRKMVTGQKVWEVCQCTHSMIKMVRYLLQPGLMRHCE